MLTLRLVQVPQAAVVGIYNGKMPTRSLFVHPDAYPSFQELAKRLVFSDIFRSAESSLSAIQRKAGVQPPSYSHHNYGGAVDVDIRASMKRGGFRTRAALDEWMTSLGWPMFWIAPGADPRGNGFEAWHHSYLHTPVWDPVLWPLPAERSTAAAAERWIWLYYGDALRPDDRECQRMLAKLGMYSGAIDGKVGPISRAAIGAFQRAWRVGSYARKKGASSYQEGALDPVTRRVLAYVSAERSISPAGTP